jgi:hypothetical protein
VSLSKYLLELSGEPWKVEMKPSSDMRYERRRGGEIRDEIWDMGY